jgi:hypothetical protein
MIIVIPSSPTSASTTSIAHPLANRRFARSFASSGGIALISDYKRRTGEYADEFRKAGLAVEKKRGNLITTFPPLTVIIARKAM